MKRAKLETHPEVASEGTPESANQETVTVVETESTEAILHQAEAVMPNVTPASEEAVVEVMESKAETEITTGSESTFSIAQVLPAMSEQTSKAVYGAFYYASYGVVFSTLLVARMMPMDNLIGRAVRKGASDAKLAIEKSEEARNVQEQTPTDASVVNA